jgi:hypothetical protein
MARGRVQAADRMGWNHAAAICCVIANANRAKGRAFTPADFNPYTRPNKGHRIRVTADNIEVLKALITPATAGPGRLSK